MSHVSIVPNSSSPASARALAPGTLSSSHLIFDPEKYASGCSPVLRRIISAWPPFTSPSMISEVRRHCQTMAFAIGSPVALSQITVVSR